MITIIVPEWVLWAALGMWCISTILSITTVILKHMRLKIARETKTISDEIIEKYSHLL